MGKTTKKNVIISNRLKKIEELLGLNPSEMAEIGGCSQATYYRYRKGESIPDSVFLNNIIRNEKNIRAEWLLVGTGPILSTDNNSENNETNESGTDQLEFVNLPLYQMRPKEGDSEGKLSLKQWENPSYSLPLCNIFLDGILQEPSDQLFAMRVGCDSMSPEIRPESLVLVNSGKTNISSDGIFVIRFDDVVRMKLLQRLPDNRLLLTTINKKYDPVEINEDSVDHFKVLGRIVWVGTPI
jgi:transcriptional regulator with XRE-family HTH domain